MTLEAIDSAFVQAWAWLDTLKANDWSEWSLEQNLRPLPEVVSWQAAELIVTLNANKLTGNNGTHRSSTDGEAGMAQKPGKPLPLEDGRRYGSPRHYSYASRSGR